MTEWLLLSYKVSAIDFLTSLMDLCIAGGPDVPEAVRAYVDKFCDRIRLNAFDGINVSRF